MIIPRTYESLLRYNSYQSSILCFALETHSTLSNFGNEVIFSKNGSKAEARKSLFSETWQKRSTAFSSSLTKCHWCNCEHLFETMNCGFFLGPS